MKGASILSTIIFLTLISLSIPLLAQEAGPELQPPARDSAEETAALPNDRPERSIASVLFSLDPLKKKGPDEKKITSSISAGLIKNFGNSDVFSINGSASVSYNNGITALSLHYETFYGESGSVLSEHKGQGIINLDHYVHPRIEIFIFSTGEFNEMSRLLFRNNTGAGAKLVIFRNRYWAPDFSAAPVYQYEKYSAQKEEHEARASFRFRLKVTPVDPLLLQFVAFYVPAFDDGENYRFNIDTFLQVKITSFTIPGVKDTETGCGKSGLYLIGGYKREFNNRVPDDTKKLDQTLYFRISFLI
ncbi:MAG TPA: DUF481 domain-containing protein [Spirochaetota bacterium]|nr:DUF481 domain-containing protein [Spirochaetota bacterium]HPI89086.1 DUF481 domain-containing protein [Spirochaetota bacterium]HPR48703.1 DUF481 domain-containing protein [Spirochaetota bacterium]